MQRDDKLNKKSSKDLEGESADVIITTLLLAKQQEPILKNL
jgi:hypothetical protein